MAIPVSPFLHTDPILWCLMSDLLHSRKLSWECRRKDHRRKDRQVRTYRTVFTRRPVSVVFVRTVTVTSRYFCLPTASSVDQDLLFLYLRVTGTRMRGPRVQHRYLPIQNPWYSISPLSSTLAPTLRSICQDSAVQDLVGTHSFPRSSMS